MRRNSWPPDPLECWRIVASGRKRALPKGFWEGDEGLERIRAVVGHLLANGLVPLSLTDSKARALHIRGAVYRAGGLFELIDMVFPGKYFPWQMRKCSPCLWKDKRDVWGPRAVRWLVGERLRMPVEEVPKRLKLAHFCENNLGGLAKSCSSRLFVLAGLGYLGLLRPWQFKKSKDWWKDDGLCREAILRLLSVHGLDSPSVAHRIKRLDFKRAGLRRLLEVRFGGSVEAALRFVYGDQIRSIDPYRFNREAGRKGAARRQACSREGAAG